MASKSDLALSLRILNQTISDVASASGTAELDSSSEGHRLMFRGRPVGRRMPAREMERFLDGAAELLRAVNVE